jgi:hypothetical protein
VAGGKIVVEIGLDFHVLVEHPTLDGALGFLFRLLADFYWI